MLTEHTHTHAVLLSGSQGVRKRTLELGVPGAKTQLKSIPFD